MKVLVIHESPDTTKTTIVEMTELEYALFSRAQGVSQGSDCPEDYIADAMDWAFCKDPNLQEWCEHELSNTYFGTWVSFLEDDITDLTGVDKMITCNGGW